MRSKLQLLAEKVERALDLLGNLRQENASLKAENADIRAELAKMKKEYNELMLGSADRSDAVRTKLTAVLGRLEELESLHQ